MDETNALRPLIADAIDNFRFGTAAFALRRAARLSGANAPFIKHLADIYDNLHILWLSPERDVSDIAKFAIPVFDQFQISDVERRHFETERKRVLGALIQLNAAGHWRAGGSLLKSYYCLANGSNLGALVLFGRSLRHLRSANAPFPDTDKYLSSISDCAVASTSVAGDGENPGVNFSLYFEFDKVRGWLKERMSVDIYAIQKNITPHFRFGQS